MDSLVLKQVKMKQELEVLTLREESLSQDKNTFRIQLSRFQH
jgi:hypothetical protein